MTVWLTQHDIARRLKVKPGTVRQWMYRGKLPIHDESVNGRPVWRLQTIEAWLSDQKSS